MESTASSSLSSGSTANNHHLDPLAGNTDSENDTEHSSTVALVQLPAASPPDIIRATQKDTFYMYQLQTAIADIIGDIWGSRSQSKYTSEVRLASEALYYGLTMLSGAGPQTLGEEYCDMLQVTDRVPALFKRRFIFLLLQVLGPYIMERAIQRLKKSETDGSLRQISPSMKRTLVRLGKAITGPMASLHMASFYIFGTYYQVAKRLSGIQYVLLRRLRVGEQGLGYEVLGFLIYTQLMIQAVHHWYGHLFGTSISAGQVEYDDSHLDTSDHHEVSQSQKCTLCLGLRKTTTATPCGHLFCWKCISEWCRNKPECPLCRQFVDHNQLYPLVNF
ncbi:hypothetical protein BASA62_006180 [Batrachochytrium salamandrivorans]|nr:hypothetical protein BASA62_006180 [Batrachochytrium salamandrivorans]